MVIDRSAQDFNRGDSYLDNYRYRDGTTHVIFEPVDFIAKLAALVPKPRVNLTRLCGDLHSPDVGIDAVSRCICPEQ